jgi:hypothetical protein
MPNIPEELFFVQRLVYRVGVAGTLVLIAVHCRDLGVMKPDASAEERVAARLWQQRVEILEGAAEQIRRIEPDTDSGKHIMGP